MSGRFPGWIAALVVGVALPTAVAALAEDAGGMIHVHRVATGETLSHVALQRLGDPSLWPAIYEANRDQIKDPSLIYPGQELAIPSLDPAGREAARRQADARNGS